MPAQLPEAMAERRCRRYRCDTKLSRYNARDFCHAHAPVRFPRVRGRVVDRQLREGRSS